MSIFKDMSLAMVGFISGYIVGSNEDSDFKEDIEEYLSLLKPMMGELQDTAVDVIDSLEGVEADEIKANIVKTLDNVKEKFTILIEQDSLEGQLEMTKNQIREVTSNMKKKTIKGSNISKLTESVDKVRKKLSQKNNE